MAHIAWTAEEYEIMLANYDLSNEALSDLLPRRTVGAVAAQKEVIHSYHTGGAPNFQPSQVLQEWLSERRSTFTCPACGVRF